MNIYLDNAATTMVAKEVVEATIPFFCEDYANPSSIHSMGNKVSMRIEDAKDTIANYIGASSSEIYFTSGATESNNWAIKTAFEIYKDNGKHIIISSVEHESIIKTVEYLEKYHGAEVTYIGVDKNGVIDINELKDAIRDDTIIISVMYVNNEVGSIMPIEQIAHLANNNGIFFHCDAVQALGKIDIDVKRLGISSLSLSAHKIHSFKGIGLLYIDQDIKFRSFIHGGHQQHSRRAGTENVASIIAFEKSIELLEIKSESINDLRLYFVDEVLKNISDIKLNTDISNSVNNILNICISNTDSEELLVCLDREGIYASAGSACTSGTVEPSHVLKAMGLDYKDIRASIRFSLSKYTTKEEIDYTVAKLVEIVEKLRSFEF